MMKRDAVQKAIRPDAQQHLTLETHASSVVSPKNDVMSATGSRVSLRTSDMTRVRKKKAENSM
jgi:hypothetical protein